MAANMVVHMILGGPNGNHAVPGRIYKHENCNDVIIFQSAPLDKEITVTHIRIYLDGKFSAIVGVEEANMQINDEFQLHVGTG